MHAHRKVVHPLLVVAVRELVLEHEHESRVPADVLTAFFSSVVVVVFAPLLPMETHQSKHCTRIFFQLMYTSQRCKLGAAAVVVAAFQKNNGVLMKMKKTRRLLLLVDTYTTAAVDSWRTYAHSSGHEALDTKSPDQNTPPPRQEYINPAPSPGSGEPRRTPRGRRGRGRRGGPNMLCTPSSCI